MESLKERLLKYYGWDEERLAEETSEPSSLSFPSLFGNVEAEKAKKRLSEAKERKEKTIVYGDYDTDGILGTSIFLSTLKEFGLEASYFIPSRYSDGYGLNNGNAKRMAEAGYTLVILIDNGVSCLEPIEYLKGKGIDTLVFDHHEFPETLPPCLSLVHPLTMGVGGKDGFNISAGFVSYLFSCFLLEKEDRYLRTLAGITTLSDMMPLLGINRTLVRLALNDLNENRYEQICLLSEKTFIDEKVLGMEIIPAINALGRMNEDHKTSLAVAYFSKTAGAKRQAIASWMKEVNEERKKLTKEAASLVKYKKGASGIIANLNIKEGLNGLIANRLMKEHKVPTAIFSSSYADPNLLVGSIRAEDGFDVLDCLKSLAPYCLTSGGHAQAGGLSILASDYPSFGKAFIAYCLSHPFIAKEPEAIPLSLSEATMESYKTIRLFGPFGEKHKEPTFVLTNLSCDSFLFSSDGRYLMTPLGYGVRLVSFLHGKKDFIGKEKTSFYVTFGLNEYRGRNSLQLLVSSSPSKA